MDRFRILRSLSELCSKMTQHQGAAPQFREVYVSPCLELFRGQSLELDRESVALASVSNVKLIARKPPLNGPLLLAIAGAFLGALGTGTGAQGIGVAISGIPWLLVGLWGIARRRSRTVLVIATYDGRTRVLYSSNSEILERLAHELRQSIGHRQLPETNQELALASVQSA